MTDPFDAIRKSLGLSDAQLARFERASKHPYECRCPLCVEWWTLVPPENETESARPPFIGQRGGRE